MQFNQSCQSAMPKSPTCRKSWRSVNASIPGRMATADLPPSASRIGRAGSIRSTLRSGRCGFIATRRHPFRSPGCRCARSMGGPRTRRRSKWGFTPRPAHRGRGMAGHSFATPSKRHRRWDRDAPGLHIRPQHRERETVRTRGVRHLGSFAGSRESRRHAAGRPDPRAGVVILQQSFR